MAIKSTAVSYKHKQYKASIKITSESLSNYIYEMTMKERVKYIKKLAKLKEQIRKLVIEAEKC